MFRDVIADETDLRALLGTPSEVAVKKQLARLDAHCRAIIAHAPFVLLATADAEGRCDVSPKGDPAGFVRVLDDPRVGLLFLVPGRGETLRVNGRACITRDADLLATLAVADKTPSLAIGV